MENRTTSNDIKELNENEIFVFGSNLAGKHIGGADNLAAFAKCKFGAKEGVGIGFTGKCYAIPTVADNLSSALSIEEIAVYVDNFIADAILNPEKTFFVTAIGCGIVGYNSSEIAPLFTNAIKEDNIHLPAEFWKVLMPIHFDVKVGVKNTGNGYQMVFAYSNGDFTTRAITKVEYDGFKKMDEDHKKHLHNLNSESISIYAK